MLPTTRLRIEEVVLGRTKFTVSAAPIVFVASPKLFQLTMAVLVVEVTVTKLALVNATVVPPLLKTVELRADWVAGSAFTRVGTSAIGLATSAVRIAFLTEELVIGLFFIC